MKVSTDLFIMGITLGWGPCLSFCAPIVATYIAASQKGWIKGLLNTLAFSFSRLAAYVILSITAFLIGHTAVRAYFESGAGRFIYLVVGAIVIILGILLIFKKSPHFQFCRRFVKNPFQNNIKGTILLGLIIGFSPCIPLFGVLAYIAFEAHNLLQATFYGGCFGAGTVITPLIPIGVLAGGFPSLIFRKYKVFNIFTRICGGILVYFGIRLIA